MEHPREGCHPRLGSVLPCAGDWCRYLSCCVLSGHQLVDLGLGQVVLDGWGQLSDEISPDLLHRVIRPDLVAFAQQERDLSCRESSAVSHRSGSGCRRCLCFSLSCLHWLNRGHETMDFSTSSTLAQGIHKHQGKGQEKEKPDDLVNAEEDHKPKLKSGHGHNLVCKGHAKSLQCSWLSWFCSACAVRRGSGASSRNACHLRRANHSRPKDKCGTPSFLLIPSLRSCRFHPSPFVVFGTPEQLDQVNLARLDERSAWPSLKLFPQDHTSDSACGVEAPLQAFAVLTPLWPHQPTADGCCTTWALLQLQSCVHMPFWFRWLFFSQQVSFQVPCCCWRQRELGHQWCKVNRPASASSLRCQVEELAKSSWRTPFWSIPGCQSQLPRSELLHWASSGKSGSTSVKTSRSRWGEKACCHRSPPQSRWRWASHLGRTIRSCAPRCIAVDPKSDLIKASVTSDDQVNVRGLFGIPQSFVHLQELSDGCTGRSSLSQRHRRCQVRLRLIGRPCQTTQQATKLALFFWSCFLVGLCLSGLLDVEGLDLVDVLLQVKGDSGRVQGLRHLTPTERLLVAIIDAAKLEAMQEDMQPLCIASWFTMGLTCVFFAAHALSRSQNVIHMDAEDTVHHIVVALVLEHLKRRVTIHRQSDWHVDAAIELVLPQLDLMDQCTISCFVPLPGCSDISKGRLRHLHHLMFFKSHHLSQQASHVSWRLTIDLHLFGDIVRLQKRRLHIHGGELPSLDTGQCHHQVLAKSRHRWGLCVKLALDDVLVLEALKNDSSMWFVLPVAQEKSHWHNGSRRACCPLEGSPGIILVPWNQCFALGLCKGSFLIGRQPTLHDCHHDDIIFRDLHHAHLLNSRLLRFWLTIISSGRHHCHSRSWCLCSSTCGQLLSWRRQSIQSSVVLVREEAGSTYCLFIETSITGSNAHIIRVNRWFIILFVDHPMWGVHNARMFFFQLPFDLLLDVGHASGVVVKVFVLVGHHFIQEGLVRGLGFRFGFLTVGVVDPKVDSRFRQLGFRPSFGLVCRLPRSMFSLPGSRFDFGCFWCFRRVTARFMWRGLTRCDSGWSSPPKLRKIVRRLSLASNVNGPNWTSHWLESFQKSFLQRFLHALKVGRLALTLVALRDSLKAQLLSCSSHKGAAVNDPVDHGLAVDWGFHGHHHRGSTPPERVELMGLWFPVVDIVSHHELVFLHSWSSQSGWSNRQVKVGRVEGLCSLLFDLHDLCQVSRITKVFGSRFIRIASFGGNIAKCQSGGRSTFHRRQTVSLMAGHQDGLFKIQLGHVAMENFQHASSDCMIALQNSKLVVSTSWYQVHEHSMGRCPFGKLCPLMWTRGIQSQDFRETKGAAPSWLEESYLHVGRLFFDLHVNFVATELIHDGEDRTLFSIPFHVEGVDGHGVVEVWGFVQSRHAHILGLCPCQTGRTLVPPSHLDKFIGKVSCLHRQNQLGTIGMPKLSMKIGHRLQNLMATDLDELFVLFKVLHLFSRFVDDLQGHQFSLSSSLPCQLHCRVNGVAKSLAKFRFIVLHFLEDRTASHHLDMSSSGAFTTQVHSLADSSWAWSKPCGLSHIDLVLGACLQLCAAAIQDCFKVALHGVQSWGFEWSCVCRILKSRVIDKALAVDVDVLVEDQMGLLFQDPQISEQLPSLWCSVVQVTKASVS